MKERLIYANNDEGWGLELRQYWDPQTHDATRRPLVFIPGYCMNTFILNYHPRGDSLVRFLTREGFEVWTANLRGQGGARRQLGSKKFGFGELSLVDLPTVFRTVQRRRRSGPDQLDVVGCSLGATFLFAYLAHHRDSHPFGSIISLGGPLRWESVHPLVEVVFASPRLAGVVKIRGTRAVAQRLLPFVKQVPAALSLYMNANRIDLATADQLVRTIDNPVPYLNQQIAHWVKERDLIVRGVNVTDAMADIDLPLLCVAANRDGIVPPENVASAMHAFGASDAEVLRVGDDENWFAHADLFVNDEAEHRVFAPMSSWLQAHQ